MDKEYCIALAKVRLGRAQGLLQDAKNLLEKAPISLQITGHYM